MGWGLVSFCSCLFVSRVFWVFGRGWVFCFIFGEGVSFLGIFYWEVLVFNFFFFGRAGFLGEGVVFVCFSFVLGFCLFVSLPVLSFEGARVWGFFVGGDLGVFNYLFCLGEQAFCLFVCFGRLVEVCFSPHEYQDAALHLQGVGFGTDAVMRCLTPSLCLPLCFPGFSSLLDPSPTALCWLHV